VFRNVRVLIFVFDIKSETAREDLADYSTAIELLAQYSRNAKVFVLLHKMDLVVKDQREAVATARAIEIHQASRPFVPLVFQTSIWHDTLYKVRPVVVYRNTLAHGKL